MKIQSVVNSIISAVKSKDELKGVNCIYSLSPDIAENPLCAFTLCIALGKAQYKSDETTRGSSFLTEVKLSLLAPSGAGGKRLSEVALWVCEAIRESLSVSLITVSEPKVLSTSSALYSDISVTVEDVSFEDSDFDIYVNGVFAEGVVLFEAESIYATEKKAELLKGYRETKTGDCEYILKLTSLKSLKNTDILRVKADYKDFEEVYLDCSVLKCRREINKSGEVSFCYTVRAQNMERTYKEVQSEQ